MSNEEQSVRFTKCCVRKLFIMGILFVMNGVYINPLGLETD